jgi:hypothetical protein
VLCGGPDHAGQVLGPAEPANSHPSEIPQWVIAVHGLVAPAAGYHCQETTSPASESHCSLILSLSLSSSPSLLTGAPLMLEP